MAESSMDINSNQEPTHPDHENSTASSACHAEITLCTIASSVSSLAVTENNSSDEIADQEICCCPPKKIRIISENYEDNDRAKCIVSQEQQHFENCDESSSNVEQVYLCENYDVHAKHLVSPSQSHLQNAKDNSDTILSFNKSHLQTAISARENPGTIEPTCLSGSYNNVHTPSDQLSWPNSENAQESCLGSLDKDCIPGKIEDGIDINSSLSLIQPAFEIDSVGANRSADATKLNHDQKAVASASILPYLNQSGFEQMRKSSGALKEDSELHEAEIQSRPSLGQNHSRSEIARDSSSETGRDSASRTVKQSCISKQICVSKKSHKDHVLTSPIHRLNRPGFAKFSCSQTLQVLRRSESQDSGDQTHSFNGSAGLRWKGLGNGSNGSVFSEKSQKSETNERQDSTLQPTSSNDSAQMRNINSSFLPWKIQNSEMHDKVDTNLDTNLSRLDQPCSENIHDCSRKHAYDSQENSSTNGKKHISHTSLNTTNSTACPSTGFEVSETVESDMKSSNTIQTDGYRLSKSIVHDAGTSKHQALPEISESVDDDDNCLTLKGKWSEEKEMSCVLSPSAYHCHTISDTYNTQQPTGQSRIMTRKGVQAIGCGGDASNHYSDKNKHLLLSENAPADHQFVWRNTQRPSALECQGFQMGFEPDSQGAGPDLKSKSTLDSSRVLNPALANASTSVAWGKDSTSQSLRIDFTKIQPNAPKLNIGFLTTPQSFESESLVCSQTGNRAGTSSAGVTETNSASMLNMDDESIEMLSLTVNTNNKTHKTGIPNTGWQRDTIFPLKSKTQKNVPTTSNYVDFDTDSDSSSDASSSNSDFPRQSTSASVTSARAYHQRLESMITHWKPRHPKNKAPKYGLKTDAVDDLIRVCQTDKHRNFFVKSLTSSFNENRISTRGDLRIDDLPLVLLIHVFSFLPVITRIGVVSLVCKKWQSAIFDPSLWRRLDLRNLPRLRDDVLLQLSSLSDRVGSLVLSDGRSTLLTDEGVTRTLKQCPYLTKIKFNRCFFLSDVAFESVGRNCRGLVYLNLSGCFTVSDRTLLAIGKGCSHLQDLDLAQCAKITSTGVCAIAKGCPLLIRLRLDQCSKLTNQAVEALTNHCPDLQFLHLLSCALTDAGISHLSKLNKLQVLDLSNVTQLSPRVVEQVTGHCPRLETLALSMNRAVDDHCLGQVVTQCPKLRCLSCVACGLSDTGLYHIAKHAQNLERLDVAWCSDITDKGITQVSASCSKLGYLGFMRCGQITMATIEHLVQKYPRIYFSNFELESKRILRRAAEKGFSC